MEIRKMRRMAQELVRALARKAGPDVGITIIIHAAKPANGEWPMALETTLTSRQLYRALLAEAVTSSALLDGGTVDNIAEIVTSDYNAAVGKSRRSDA